MDRWMEWLEQRQIDGIDGTDTDGWMEWKKQRQMDGIDGTEIDGIETDGCNGCNRYRRMEWLEWMEQRLMDGIDLAGWNISMHGMD